MQWNVAALDDVPIVTVKSLAAFLFGTAIPTRLLDHASAAYRSAVGANRTLRPSEGSEATRGRPQGSGNGERLRTLMAVFPLNLRKY